METFTLECIKNESGRNELKVGNIYRVFEHDHPKIWWVFIPDPTPENPDRCKTIQAYKSDFIDVKFYIRDNKIEQILK